MPDRYKAGPLLDGSDCWAIFSADDPDLDRPLIYPIYDAQAADDLAVAMSRAGAEDSSTTEPSGISG